MQITFLGTRGYIDSRTRKHYRHTSTLIEYRGKRVMIDCGLDWTKVALLNAKLYIGDGATIAYVLW